MTKTTTALTDDLQFGADEARNAAPDDKDDKFLWGAKAIAEEIDAELRPRSTCSNKGICPRPRWGARLDDEPFAAAPILRRQDGRRGRRRNRHAGDAVEGACAEAPRQAKAPATRTAEITETPPRERQGFCRFRRCQPPKTEDHKRDRAK